MFQLQRRLEWMESASKVADTYDVKLYELKNKLWNKQLIT